MINTNSLKRDGLRQAEFCNCYFTDSKTTEIIIPARSQPGLTMTTPTASHWGLGDKYTTGGTKVKKTRGRENISIGPLNVMILRPAEKLERLIHELDGYHWNILGLCEMLFMHYEGFEEEAV